MQWYVTSDSRGSLYDTKREYSAKYNKTRVSIGDEYDRWTELSYS